MNIRPILSTLLRHKTAAALIVLEIALSCAIICNALFLIGTRITQINEISGLAENELVRVQLAGIGENANADAQTLSDLAALRGLPGVRQATVVNQVPFLNSSWNSSVNLQKDQRQPTLSATVYMAESAFIDTFGLNLVAGRNFTADEYADYSVVSRPDSPGVIPAAIITRSMADRLFPAGNAVGQTFYSWGDEPIRIVGVVEHLVRPSRQGGPEAREYSMILPLRPAYSLGGNYVLRTDPDRREEVLAAAVAALRGNGPERIVLEDATTTFQALRETYYQRERSMAWLLVAVIVGLLVVTALGIVGLASFWVQQRTKQIGVRRALGATRGQILRYFQTENFLLATVGIALGMALAYGINLLLMEHYELARLPALYLPVGAVALWVLGQVAVFGPARRAAAVPPAVATRSV
ncbi:ABC transporter permease [Lysobacter sp. H21R4]|uniref:ABC transporter permease n=1 Tax=Lysobacter sp. H21R4 TaxID=2781021 RepID=UPI0018896575|nr:FtsX-like permease family protein [Lysobacter sp. H21R4]QOY62446.1 ABC transporter permease [Lysobacter sp. H21R4]